MSSRTLVHTRRLKSERMDELLIISMAKRTFAGRFLISLGDKNLAVICIKCRSWSAAKKSTWIWIINSSINTFILDQELLPSNNSSDDWCHKQHLRWVRCTSFDNSMSLNSVAVSYTKHIWELPSQTIEAQQKAGIAESKGVCEKKNTELHDQSLALQMLNRLESPDSTGNTASQVSETTSLLAWLGNIMNDCCAIAFLFHWVNAWDTRQRQWQRIMELQLDNNYYYAMSLKS